MAVVLVRPDEAIGCGAVLNCLKGVHLAIVTNGAERGLSDHTSFPVAMLRWQELLGALEIAGHRPSAVTGLGIPEGEAGLHIAPMARRLAGIFALHGIAVAATHAYQNDEPDRNAVAFAVQDAAALCGRRGQPVSLLEVLPIGLLPQPFP